MREIAIIGAGQSGLQLAIGLKKAGYFVTLYANQTAKQILNGKILSNQGMFGSALKLERLLDLNFWDKLCPQNSSVTFTISDPSTLNKTIYWQGTTHYSYQSIDQRLKFSRWMDFFQQLGGNLIIKEVGLSDLDNITKDNQLTILAVGKGELNSIFKRNNDLSNFTNPQRFLSCLYVKGVISATDSSGVRANVLPGIGEYFIMPGLTINGHCEMMLFEGLPGGPFDCWRELRNIEQQLEVSIRLLNKYLPWEAERCRQIEPTDQQANLIGGYTPMVKHPTSTLASGKLVFGLGDAVVLNDPIAGQGANNACKAADLYLRNIIKHENNPFDEQWMTQTFNEYWNTVAMWATRWSNMLLLPPTNHMISLLTAAVTNTSIANTLANAFDEPSSLFPWIEFPEKTAQFIKNHEEGLRLNNLAQGVTTC